MSLLYKPLFEVKLLHEYFITDSEGNTPFDDPDPESRMLFLEKAFASGRQSIDKYLYAALPEKIRDNTNNIKLIPSYSGFKVFIQVKKKVLTDGREVYEPFLPLPWISTFSIQLLYRDIGLDQYTNGRTGRPTPSLYFFWNGNVAGDKSYPYINNPVPPRSWSQPYEQGELALIGTGAEEFYKDLNGADAWRPVTGSHFANESDRVLLPLRFTYKFSNSDTVTKAAFVLKDSKGNELKKIDHVAAGPNSSLSLDFSDVAATLKANGPVEDQLYSLEVTGDGGYLYNSKVIFSNELYDKNVWGVVHISLSSVDKDYNLLDDDGYLVAYKDKDGIKFNPRTFEIPIKSRLGYWRYKNDHGYELDLVPELTGYLFKTRGLLQSKSPRAVANTYFLLSSDLAVEKKYLPNPVNYNPVKDDLGRLCFDIKVPECDLFPLLP